METRTELLQQITLAPLKTGFADYDRLVAHYGRNITNPIAPGTVKGYPCAGLVDGQILVIATRPFEQGQRGMVRQVIRLSGLFHETIAGQDYAHYLWTVPAASFIQIENLSGA